MCHHVEIEMLHPPFLFGITKLHLQEESEPGVFGSDYIDVRSGEVRPRHYYIAAEEITWDYGIKTPHQFIKPR